MATQTSNWVQSAIQELRRSDEYKHQVIDEWYETLPVAQWNDSVDCRRAASRMRDSISFGRDSLDGVR